MKFSHLDSEGRAQMVDISAKKRVERIAEAEGEVRISSQTRDLVEDAGLPKGNPFEVARIAGIQAAKRASELIPLCHPLSLDHVELEIELMEDRFRIWSRVRCRWATGVEMEALAAVSVAALTIYDMCKAVDSNLTISNIRLLKKSKGE